MEEQTKTSDKIFAWVYVLNNTIQYIYEVDGKQYSIGVPKTENNAHLKHGDSIELSLMIRIGKSNEL